MRVTRQAARHDLISRAMEVVSNHLFTMLDELRTNVVRLNQLWSAQRDRSLQYFRLWNHNSDEDMQPLPNVNPWRFAHWRMMYEYYHNLLARQTMPQTWNAEQAVVTAHVGSCVSGIIARVTRRGRS